MSGKGKYLITFDKLGAWIVNIADQRVTGNPHPRPFETFLEEKDLFIQTK
jgi:hypothetical protein